MYFVADPSESYNSNYENISLNDWLKGINEKADVNYCVDKLHKATMSILKNYTFELKDYFPAIKDDLRDYYPELEKYLLGNMKLNLCTIKNLYLTDKKYINLDDSLKNYIKFNKNFKNITMREYILNGTDIDSKTFSDKRAKYRKNLNSLKEKPSIFEINTKYFYKDDIRNEEINEIANHILLYTLDNWKDFSANDEDHTRITYKDIKKFFGEFLDCDVNTTDIFLFEKIYKIYYKIGIYLIGFNQFNDFLSLSIKYMKELAEDLTYILQLPNLIAGFDLFNIIMQEYINIFISDKFDDFKDVIKICKHISYYLIPLYNMVFANILKIYCNANDMGIEEFLQTKFKDEDILKEYRDKCKLISSKIDTLDAKKFEKKFKEKDKKQHQEQIELIKLIALINTEIEENKEYKNKIKDILQHTENLDLEFLNIIKDRESYQKNLKQLILNGIISK